MQFITVNRKQLNLLGYSLDEFVEPGSKSRFVVDLVSSLELKDLYDKFSPLGTKPIDPSVLLATWFFAYSEGVTSTRIVEDRCKRDTHYMYISGLLKPDHTTLSRFRQNNLELLCDYFAQIIQLAQQKGLSDFKAISIDGSKIQAATSPTKSKNADELSRYLSAVRKDIMKYMQQCDENDVLEEGAQNENIDSVRKKLRKLQKLEKTLVKRQQQMKVRKNKLKKEHQDKHQINLTEPDAANMRHVNGKQTLPAYNPQVSTDTKTQLIVANDVVCERNDFQQFSVQHQAVEKNLGSDKDRQFDLDSGYHSLEQLEYASQNQIDAVIADPTPENRSTKRNSPTAQELIKSGRQLTRSDFVYHSKKDYYGCPAGEKLYFFGIQSKDNQVIRIYKSRYPDCDCCLFIKLCHSPKNKSGIRTIRRDEREIFAENMYLKLQSDQAKARLKRRAMTVEPVFGNLKENLGFRRFHLRGLAKVKGEFNLMCIAHNINKLFKMIGDIYTFFVNFVRYGLKIEYSVRTV